MKIWLLIINAFITVTLVVGQDQYHQELIDALDSENNVGTPEFVIFNTEAQNVENMFVYGNAQRSSSESADNNWSIELNFDVPAAGTNQWDAGTGIRNETVVSSGDIIVMTFWGKQNSNESSLFVFAENSTTFDKQVYFNLILTADWTQYYIVYKSSADFNPAELTFGFHLAGVSQNFDIAGFTVLNYKQNAPIEAFPSTFSPSLYGGHEEDAAWRPLAQNRIENIRKSNVQFEILWSSVPLDGATVTLEMQEHAFGFGSALVACRFPGNRCFDPTYVEKLTNLDGEGHGFNVSVMENALKWDGWEEEWLGTPDQTTAAVQWLADNRIEMRGHTMFWPGFNMLPDDIRENQNNLDYVRTRIDERIDRMVNDPTLNSLIREWDVLNEITVNRDFEQIFDQDPNFNSGREIYPEIFKKIKEADSTQIIYVNDYVVLSGGGSSPTVVDRYKQFLQEMYDSEYPFEGIGFQCHIGSSPTSILKIESTLNEFYQRFQVPIKITEYDIDVNVDEETQAKYMSDFLTMIFSHPGVEAFLMWGFWDGNHWKGNAPMFREDWSLKPSGQAFIDKVFNEWWSKETLITDQNGKVEFRVFNGLYKLTIEKDGEVYEDFIEITEETDESLDLLFTTSVDQRLAQFQITPNPILDEVQIILPDDMNTTSITIMDTVGKIIMEKQIINRAKLSLGHLTSGTYLIKFDDRGKVFTKKILIQ